MFLRIIALVLATLATPAFSKPAEPKRILAIYSYEPSFSLTRNISLYLHKRFDGTHTLDEEFLYTKKYDPETMFKIGLQALRRKLQVTGQPDIVLTFDDNAIIFAERHRAELFPGVPIVFGGVNSRQRVMDMAALPNITGVLEEIWIDEIINLAIRLNPHPLRRVIAISDDTRTSQVVLDMIRQSVESDHALSLEIIDTSKMTFEEALQRVEEERDPGAIILHSAAFRDRAGATMTNEEIAHAFGDRASRPFYSYLDTTLANGATAGYVISGDGIAEASVVLAERILAGENPDAIAPVLESPNILLIDEPRARQFGLEFEHLRNEAKILRPIPSPWQRYRHALFATCILIVIMAILLLAVIVANRRVRSGLLTMNQALSDKNNELVEAKNRIEHQSLHDSLTRLANRRYLERKLKAINDKPKRHKTYALFHIDIDRFKQINDTLGHLAGDVILRRVADMIVEAVPQSAFVARVGGDEYVVLTAFSNATDAKRFGANLAEVMRRTVTVDGIVTRISASIGLATVSPEEVFDSNELQRRADVALYLAKTNGRARSATFLPEHDIANRERKRLADDIMRGLEADEFVPYFQPQLSAKTGRVIGVETLARWNHPEKGVLTPAAFLPVAESIGAVASIDKVMLEKSAQCAAQLRAAGIVLPQLSVNVSAKRLLEGDLPDMVSRLDFGGTALCFELVESIFLDNADEALDTAIERLKNLGVKIEVDDFGTGHASIVGVRRLKPNRLKIARELTAPIEKDSKHRQLIRGIVQIGRSLDIQLTAEGVETERQACILRDLGCDVFQGFLYSKPIRVDELLVFARRAGIESEDAEGGAMVKQPSSLEDARERLERLKISAA